MLSDDHLEPLDFSDNGSLLEDVEDEVADADQQAAAHRMRLPYEPSYDPPQRATLKVQPHFKCFEPHALALKVPA